MTDRVISRPASKANSTTILDFLELVALIDPSGRARIDTLIRDQELQAEQAEDDFGDADTAKDGFVENIENEFNRRASALGESYPFLMTDDAEEIVLQVPENDPLAGSYLACLIASQIGDKGDLKLSIPDQAGLAADIITRMRRRIFQMIGTIALAGLAKGPAGSIGWPREEKETIIASMVRAVGRGFPIPVLEEPNWTALDGAKDGGVDVIAWEHTDMPPSPSVWFGQIASGRNWKGKPVIQDALNFSEDFLTAKHKNANHATIVPFDLDGDEEEAATLHHRHGTILDRLRLSVRFKEGLLLIADGIEMDESQNTLVAMTWVNEFVAGLRIINEAA
ncbi:hypothetical protein [uncultured Ruegeria sp.]|uniref:hypothetical protein n=1 Tax=uncultured Ruegeria sp. TaxID=259304 RepID=UPI002625AA97|nr:hypothetical protein [uncultured Ruegeria sp.]